MNRFRPNIVTVGGGPFEEDEWKSIKIGPTILHPIKRCEYTYAITNINPTINCACGCACLCASVCERVCVRVCERVCE